MGKASAYCRWAILGIVLIWMLASIGCTRVFYRRCVDRDVAEILHEKEVTPETKIENMQVYPDLRARFAEFTDPDHPPMPPDDPVARYLGPNPQGPRHAGTGNPEGTGYLDLLAVWDAENRALREARTRETAVAQVRDAGPVRTAHWQKEAEPMLGAPTLGAPALSLPTPTAKPKPYLLRVDQAMELGLINSREFQARREDLYLAALPVTRERFTFSAQYFAAGQAIREKSPIIFPKTDEGNAWRLNSAMGVTK